MPFPTISHFMTYPYRQPGAFGEQRIMVRPLESHDQRSIDSISRIDPASLQEIEAC